eukprot:3338663-Rhodomonas_salina.1
MARARAGRGADQVGLVVELLAVREQRCRRLLQRDPLRLRRARLAPRFLGRARRSARLGSPLLRFRQRRLLRSNLHSCLLASCGGVAHLLVAALLQHAEVSREVGVVAQLRA